VSTFWAVPGVWPKIVSVVSTTLGISVSLNGRRAARPNRASWNASSS